MTVEQQIASVADILRVDEETARVFLDKAEMGGDLDGLEFSNWLEERFKPNVYFLDQNEYAKMLVDALKILPNVAGTDYGSSRQRDLAQLWADTTRGYLGEQAMVKFLDDKFGIEAKLAHERGKLEDFLPLDISEVRERGSEWRKPGLRLGVKAVKFNGIWMDIPGDQFDHTDIHALVKVGVGRESLIAYLKSISVFKDKVLKQGEAAGSLTSSESKKLYEELPDFKSIPVYISGFVPKNSHYKPLAYSGHKGRIHYTVTSWNGPIRPGDLDEIKKREGLPQGGRVKFLGIGDFSHDAGYLFSTGKLLWSTDDWKKHLSGL